MRLSKVYSRLSRLFDDGKYNTWRTRIAIDFMELAQQEWIKDEAQPIVNLYPRYNLYGNTVHVSGDRNFC